MGRSWLNRDVGSMGAGLHRIDVATAGRVPPGLYFVRLTQAGWEAYQNARRTHHRGVAEHFLDQLSRDELAALTPALRRVRDRARARS